MKLLSVKIDDDLHKQLRIYALIMIEQSQTS